MPLDGFSVVLAVVSGLLIAGGLLRSIHVQLRVRMPTGESVWIRILFDKTPPPGSDEQSTGDAAGS